jgi:hypothetical protein
MDSGVRLSVTGLREDTDSLLCGQGMDGQAGVRCGVFLSQYPNMHTFLKNGR